MQAKNFQSISKVLYWAFRIYAGLLMFFAVLSLAGFLASFFVDLSVTENMSSSIETAATFSILFSDASITELEYAKAGLLSTPLFLGLMSYILIQASTLFERLAQGDSPFTYDFAGKVKKISYLLVLTDIIEPIFYTLMVNLIAETGNYLFLGVSYWSLVGLILYVFSGILNYGVNLQELSDETV